MLRCILLQVYEGIVSFFFRMILMHTLERVKKQSERIIMIFFSSAFFYFYFLFLLSRNNSAFHESVYIGPRGLSTLQKNPIYKRRKWACC